MIRGEYENVGRFIWQLPTWPAVHYDLAALAPAAAVTAPPPPPTQPPVVPAPPPAKQPPKPPVIGLALGGGLPGPRSRHATIASLPISPLANLPATDVLGYGPLSEELDAGQVGVAVSPRCAHEPAIDHPVGVIIRHRHEHAGNHRRPNGPRHVVGITALHRRLLQEALPLALPGLGQP